VKLVPVSLAVFYEYNNQTLKLWVQTREDDGPYHGFLEFPGGGIEIDESPLAAAVREVEEEVGIVINPDHAKFMGTYTNELANRTILLYVFLFPKLQTLEEKGQWVEIRSPELSQPLRGMIPTPNHRIIDELFLALQS